MLRRQVADYSTGTSDRADCSRCRPHKSSCAVWARGGHGENLNHAGAAAGVRAVLVGAAFSGEEIVEGFIDLVDAFAECSVKKSGA
jgi:hypothetical protein